VAWIRLDDNYIYHAKFTKLSDGAFRLWHEGIAYCRKMLSDGRISKDAICNFRYATDKRIAELLKPLELVDDSAPLWKVIDGGYEVHDYLVWNRSKAQELKDRDDAKERASKSRRSKSDPNIERAPHVRYAERAGSVLVMDKDLNLERTEKKKPFFKGERQLDPMPSDEIGDRARWLIERYAELFVEKRRGARFYPKPVLDYDKAIRLVSTWPENDRLEKLAVLVLTTDDEWISGTDRSFGVFAAKAQWADDRLTQWEIENGVKAS
jgi:hypothetical protein